MARMLTYEEVKSFIEVESDSGCKLLSEDYVGNNSPLFIECRCGRSFTTPYRSFKYGNKQQCNVCSGVEYDMDYVRGFVGENSNCKIISTLYTGAFDPLEFECQCGSGFTTNLNTFMYANKRHCDKCGIENSSKLQRFDFSYVKKYIKENDCTLLSKKYKNQRQKLKIMCACGEIFYVDFDNFKNKNRTQCRTCSNLIKWDYDKVKKYIEDDTDSGCKLLSNEYINSTTELTLVCKCGNEFKTTFARFKDRDKRQCSPCGYSKSANSSKGELKVRKYLKDNLIHFDEEVSFCNLLGIGGNPLRFDFAILNEDKSLASLIEYDGEFHFKKFYENQNFEELQTHDERKNQYCKQNNIPLLRIPYWDFDNIEQILEEWLGKYNLIKSKVTGQAVYPIHKYKNIEGSLLNGKTN